MKKDPVRHALAPLEFIVTAAGALLLFVLAIVIGATVVGSGSFLGLGQPIVCVDAPLSALTTTSQGTGVLGLGHGVSAVPTDYSVCAWHGSLGQRILEAGTSLPSLVFALGFLGLTWKLLRRTRRQGLFAGDIARATSRLGWYLLVGAVTVALLQAAASSWLLSTLLVASEGSSLTAFFHLSWTVLFAGFGAVTVGRALSQAAVMQEEIDATV